MLVGSLGVAPSALFDARALLLFEYLSCAGCDKILLDQSVVVGRGRVGGLGTGEFPGDRRAVSDLRRLHRRSTLPEPNSGAYERESMLGTTLVN